MKVSDQCALSYVQFATDLSGVYVVAACVDIRVVVQERSEGNASGGFNRVAARTGSDHSSGVAILANDAQAERLALGKVAAV